MENDPEQAIEQDIAELDKRVDQLEDHIEEAKDASTAEELVGDWDQTDDQSGGEDPVGAHEERDEPSEDRRPENEA
jgi:predicted  nucleic acid-binding Zn-ribbon protein